MPKEFRGLVDLAGISCNVGLATMTAISGYTASHASGRLHRRHSQLSAEIVEMNPTGHVTNNFSAVDIHLS
jgi:hypothetical protein